MASMEGLGRLFNIRHLADGGWVALTDADSVTFSCYLTGAAGDTYTLQEARDAAGTGAQNLSAVRRYYTSTGDGSDAWVERTQATAATLTTAAAAAQNHAVFAVGAPMLSDGFKYVRVTSTGAGLVTAITHDLKTQRRPSNLPALAV